MPANALGSHLIAVINHRETRIYKMDMKRGVPERVRLIGTTVCHRYPDDVDKNDGYGESTELSAYYKLIAKNLEDAESLLILCNSNGSSGAIDYLLAELRALRPALEQRIVGAFTVDEQRVVTEAQLLAKAREAYVGLAKDVRSPAALPELGVKEKPMSTSAVQPDDRPQRAGTEGKA